MAKATPKTRPKPLQDYTLRDNDGADVKLSALFGAHDYLVVVHNMGKHCPNCAVWGDEFDGMRRHLERAAAVCVVAPDDPATQRAYVKARGWHIPLYSARGTTFIRDLGFEDRQGKAQPGVSVLRRAKGGLRVVEQVNVFRDKRCPSVLEVLWMLPDVKMEQLAWNGR